MNSLPFGQLKSFLKILIGVQYDSPRPPPRGVFAGFREFDRIRRGKLLGNGQTSENSQRWIFIQIGR